MESDRKELEDLGKMGMKLQDVEHFFAEVAQRSPFDADAGINEGRAYLRIASDDGRWAVVNTPGDGWFALDVEHGFSLDHFEEETAADDVIHLLEKYIRVAEAYVGGEAVEESTRRGYVRAIRVETIDGEFRLRRSLAADFKARLGIGVKKRC